MRVASLPSDANPPHTSAQGQDLTCIQHLGLPKLRRVRELDVSHNRLLSLSELAELPRLTKLDASHNSLSAALGECRLAAMCETLSKRSRVHARALRPLLRSIQVRSPSSMPVT